MNRIKLFRAMLFVATLILSLGFPIHGTDAGTAIAHPEHATQEQLAVATPSLTAPLFDNLGDHHHPISTRNPLAQRYFDQGLILSYGFNHAEALRSFQQAAELDPTCALCYWGMAYVLGPNINAAMEDSDVPTAWAAIQRAVQLGSNASDRERAYIHALATRYAPQPVEDRTELNLAYANAMRDVAQRYPDDPDAGTLFAEALMDTTPWDYWDESGNPTDAGAEIIATLESVLKRFPNHVGALHLYIHAVEAQRPELAADVADRLRDLNIQTSHLLHMPAHIYLRVGRYHDAVVANQRAAAADREYAQAHHPDGIFRIAYMPHNHHFLWYAAMMAGQRRVALEAARNTADLVERSLWKEPGYGTLQHYAVIPLYTYVKFGLWDDILAEPKPEADLVYPTGVWHFARGMALAAKGEGQAAAQELKALKAIAADPALEGVTIWDINSTADLLKIGVEVLSGELAAKRGDVYGAIAHLEAGVALQDQLNYDEPAPWYSPVRQNLGAMLLQAGRPAEAEQVFRDDLAIYPHNGWSLYGLAQSLEAQGKTDEARQTRAQFRSAWQHADVMLTAARF
ncbi:tetratricopeptide repeat protein [Leptolyngbya sp. O-77]|uniref:tetratricopeptide repeat protein n=1 Tax=Leptolyngbya sp. O-77 TaxID=1080068 RepID=UPI00074D334B|nr:tetratricopeptide repeat protein [Leptolyngbya sp. O-77]BAU42829.1 Tetratricopeptide repeat protein [Leptolyngbya sp. O-77]